MTRPTTPSEDTIPSETSEFSFITLTGPMTDTKAISKRVRKHVMQDYVRKAKSKDAVTAVAVTPIPQLVKPANHKGKFKLDSWKRRNEAKVPPTSSSVAMQINQKNHLPISIQEVVQQPSTSSKGTSTHVLVRQRPTLEKLSSHLFRRPSSFGLQFNPFDTVAISASDKLIWYYQKSYSMNGIAINPNGDFFQHARSDPALLHSVLHLVALHLDLKTGRPESRESLYHGSQAFQIINQRLQTTETFSDMTIASVAMLANKENLNGKYHLSALHISGLHLMIAARGGIHTLTGVFLRIVLWSDFCFANINSTSSTFPRQHFPVLPPISTTLETLSYNPSPTFGALSPMVSIFDALRSLSQMLDPQSTKTNGLDKPQASNLVYNLEYDLLSLNTPFLSSEFGIEVLPLKTAVHIYLYLVIREIPMSSHTIGRMMLRLQDALEGDIDIYWTTTPVLQAWLLWILFIGYIAADQRPERAWFVNQIARTVGLLGVYTLEALEGELKKVLWREDFCGGVCRGLWGEIVVEAAWIDGLVC